jgi:hypothetical protein
MPEELSVAEDELISFDKAEVVNVEPKMSGERDVKRLETFVQQSFDTGPSNELTHALTGIQKPKTDFAKKAVVQPMRSEKLSVTEQPKTMVKQPSEEKFVGSSKDIILHFEDKILHFTGKRSRKSRRKLWMNQTK